MNDNKDICQNAACLQLWTLKVIYLSPDFFQAIFLTKSSAKMAACPFAIVQGFSYHSQIGTRGLLNLGKKTFGPSTLGRIDTGPCFHSHFYANFHGSVTLLILFGFL